MDPQSVIHRGMFYMSHVLIEIMAQPRPMRLACKMNRGTDEPRPASVSRFGVKVPLAKFVYWVHAQQELVRVCITAAIGTVLAWITYEIIYFVNWTEPRATTSWTLAFAIGVLRQHHLHRTLSFPEIDMTAGTVLNYVLTERAGLHHRQAWVACLAGVATLEYAFLKLFVFRDRRSKEIGQ